MRRVLVNLVAGALLGSLLALAPAGPAGALSLTAGTANAYRTALTTLSGTAGGPHTLTLTADIDLSTGAAPVYTGAAALTIDGAGFTIDGGGANRALDHQSTATLTLRNLTVHDATAPPGQDGGAVTVDGALIVDDSTFDQNAAGGNGGALEVQSGSLTVTDSVFSGNTASNLGGAIEVQNSGQNSLAISGSTFTGNATTGGSIGGGAVFANVQTALTIADSTFTNNTSTNDGGAVHAEVQDSAVSLTGGSFTGNQAGDSGGAVYTTAPLDVEGVTFTTNQAGTVANSMEGGAVQARAGGVITDSTFTQNTITDGDGGAVMASSSSDVLRIETSTFNGNQAVHGDSSSASAGGAVATTGAGVELDEVTMEGNAVLDDFGEGGAVVGSADIEDSVLRSNRVEGDNTTGGAVSTGFAGSVEIRRSLLRQNEVDAVGSGGGGGALGGEGTILVEQSELIGNSVTAVNGAGGAGYAADLTIRNSNLIGNTASIRGGAVAGDGGHDVVLVHVTALANDAPSGDHLSVVNATAEATLSGVAFGPAVTGTACDLPSVAVTSTGGNVIADTSCGLPAETEGVDLGLGPRRDNGGGRQSLFPLAGSAVVDTATTCTTATDLRGVPRPFGAACDAGAVEQVYPVDHAFTDVPTWVRDAVAWISSPVNDPPLMVGITPTRFEPNDPITRAQVVRMLYRLAGSPDVTALPAHPFTDVPNWVDDAVTWAHDEGIVTGITPTLFKPDDPITRAQVVRMLYRFAGSPDVTGIDPHPFTDVTAWVEDAVTWAADPDNPLPLVTGITATLFKPNDDITRAQVARMTYRLGITPAAWDTPLPPTIPAAG